MPLQPLFGVFRPLVEVVFAKAKAAGGLRVTAVELQIEEEPRDKGARAEFLVLEPAGPVRVTWNGVASLWAFSQGAGRLSRRMFDGKRRGLQVLSIDDDPELGRGLDSLELARRLCTQDIPTEAATLVSWPKWAPAIDPSPIPDSDSDTGNRLLSGALAWIFRHELAHLSLDHARREASEGLTTADCETEADLEATRWIRGALRANASRVISGRPPGPEELQLEQRALVIGIGLIWVAFFEADRRVRNTGYPPAAERLFRCITELGLREDSAAYEVLSDIIHAWLDPEDAWIPASKRVTADHAFSEAIVRLHRHLSSVTA
jgi:hypothetical protein